MRGPKVAPVTLSLWFKFHQLELSPTPYLAGKEVGRSGVFFTQPCGVPS